MQRKKRKYNYFKNTYEKNKNTKNFGNDTTKILSKYTVVWIVLQMFQRFDGASDVGAFLGMCQYLDGATFKVHHEVHSAHEILLDWEIAVSHLFSSDFSFRCRTVGLNSKKTVKI